MSYMDRTKSPEERAKELLAELSLEEKLAQVQCDPMYDMITGSKENAFPFGVGEVSAQVAITCADRYEAAELVRRKQEQVMAASPHHIPALIHTEALTGVLAPGNSSFPTGIGQASTWNVELEREMSTLIGAQAKAMGLRQVLSPVFDISRDPRFGRQAESYGEDPTLAAAMGAAFTKGMQGNGRLEDGAAATAKHFLGFMAGEGGIHAARTPIPDRALREVYAKPFQAAITEGKIAAVMNSYATLNGEPVCGSKTLLRKLLREEMGFTGLTVSDYSSVEQLCSVHRVAESRADAGQKAMEAGMNSELPSPAGFQAELLDRIRSGKMDESVLDEAVLHLLTLKFKLGLFENPFPALSEEAEDAYDRDKADSLMLRAARESMVLLKNDGVLPLSPAGKKIAVIGYHGNSVRAFFGGYTTVAIRESTVGAVSTMVGLNPENEEDMQKIMAAMEENSDRYPGSQVSVEKAGIDPMVRAMIPGIESLFEALTRECPESCVRYAYGYDYAGTDESHFPEAYDLAADTELVIVTLGGHYGWNTSSTSGEGIDRKNIGIPRVQEKFLEGLREKFPEKKVVAVHFDGHPCSSDAADRVCDAILEVWAPAEKGAQAVTDILLGKYNPSGHLPVCAAADAGQIPVYYGHERGAAWHCNPSIGFDDYVDGSRRPRYMFGHGLSYTTFAITGLRASAKQAAPVDTVNLSLEVENTGNRPGAAVVQLYFEDLYASVTRPNRELAGFAKVELAAGEKRTVSFAFDPSQCAFLDSDMRWKIEKGAIRFMAGEAADRISCTCEVEITEDRFIEGRERSFYCIGKIV